MSAVLSAEGSGREAVAAESTGTGSQVAALLGQSSLGPIVPPEGSQPEREAGLLVGELRARPAIGSSPTARPSGSAASTTAEVTAMLGRGGSSSSVLTSANEPPLLPVGPPLEGDVAPLLPPDLMEQGGAPPPLANSEPTADDVGELATPLLGGSTTGSPSQARKESEPSPPAGDAGTPRSGVEPATVVVPQGEAAVMVAPGALLSASVRQRLDAGALQALAELDSSEADAIALRLEHAGPNVRNPSAYVHRAVNNARRRVGVAVAAAAQHQLDASALAALSELPPEAAQAILDELGSKGAGVRNPSAYVVKAVGNARRGDQVGVPQPAYLSAGAPVAGRHAVHLQQRGYPMYHPQNQQQLALALAAQAANFPGQDPQRRPNGVDHHHLAAQNALNAEYSSLDPKAAAALGALPANQAAQILVELQRKRGSIRNPSAYVMRATANAHAGQLPGAFQQPQLRYYQQPQLYVPVHAPHPAHVQPAPNAFVRPPLAFPEQQPPHAPSNKRS